MKKAILLLVLVAILVLALSGTALASVQSARATVQSAMYAHTWGVGPTSDWVHLAQSGEFVPPATYPPSGVVPPSPVFQPILP